MIDTETQIRAVRTVGPDTVAIDLATPQDFAPKPGQFVKVTAFVEDEHVSRFYTLSSPGATDTFELTVAIDPDGALGPWLRDAAGATVRLEGPYGKAYYDGETQVVVLAAGPGIGAAVGIGEAAARDGNTATIVYHGDDPAHGERLDALRSIDDITVICTTDLEHEVDDDDLSTGAVFVYGFQDFVTTALERLEKAGVDPSTAKVENFG